MRFDSTAKVPAKCKLGTTDSQTASGDLQDTASSVYRDIANYDGAKSIWQQLLLAYNSQRKSANLVFFVDALDHLTRLHRVLSLPQVTWLSIFCYQNRFFFPIVLP